MKMKAFKFLCLGFLCCAGLISCAGFFDNESGTSLSVRLPGSDSRAASSDSYSYEITFTFEDGTSTVKTSESGGTIELSPATPGNYTVSGKAFDSKKNVAYEGTAKAVVLANTVTNVELILNKVYKLEDNHIKINPSGDGIEIILKYNDSDGVWDGEGSYIENVETGMKVLLSSESGELVPSETNKTSTVWYPFVEKDKIYNFRLNLVTYTFEGSGGDATTKKNIETVNCKSIRTVNTYFDFNEFSKLKLNLTETVKDEGTAGSSLNFEAKPSSNPFASVLKGSSSDYTNASLRINSYAGELGTEGAVQITNKDYIYIEDGTVKTVDPTAGAVYSLNPASEQGFKDLCGFRMKQQWCAEMEFKFQLFKYQNITYQAPLVTGKKVSTVSVKVLDAINLVSALFGSSEIESKFTWETVENPSTSFKFTISEDMNTTDIDLQIQKFYAFEEDKEYNVQFNIQFTGGDDSQGQINVAMYQSNGTCLQAEDTYPGATSSSCNLLTNVHVYSNQTLISFMPKKKGTYTITDLVITKVE